MSNLIPYSEGGKQEFLSWDKPEGKLGKVIAVLGGGALIFGFIKLLPILTAIAWNFVSFTIAVFLGIFLVSLLFSKKFWNTLSTGYLIIMHKILYALVSADPVSILNDYIHKLELQIANVESAMKNFRGLIEMNKRRLKEVEEKIADTIAKKKSYEKRGETVFVAQLDQLLVMYETSRKNRAERLETSEKWMEALEKVRQYATFSVGTNKEKIKIFKEQYEEAKQAAKAARGLKKAVNGDPELTKNFNVAMEVMEQQMSANIGEVEDMLQATTGLLREAELENGVANEKANAILEKYERGEGLFSKDTWNALPEGQERILITMPAQQEQKPKKGRYFN